MIKCKECPFAPVSRSKDGIECEVDVKTQFTACGIDVKIRDWHVFNLLIDGSEMYDD